MKRTIALRYFFNSFLLVLIASVNAGAQAPKLTLDFTKPALHKASPAC
jgi:hypothetical protein